MLLALLLTACSELAFQVPPPPAPSPTLSPLVVGLSATATLRTSLPPGTPVSFAAGTPGRGPCPAFFRGACLGVRSPSLLGQATTDAAGVARLTFSVSGVPGATIGVQAQAPTPAGPRLSGVATTSLLDPALDEDGDSLVNAAELRAGADPRVRDSDGGGVLDGQEVSRDHTDPTAPADDLDRETACRGGLDDDQDRLTDCADPDCQPCGEDCDNGVDDDLDFAPDCLDLECACVERCDNGVDDDGDGLADCDDPGCPCVEDCDNGRDDDRDLRADCQDPDCTCPESCLDGEDEDRDGLSACADPDCACGELCDNGADDDGDGLADCEDAGCADLCAEDCANGMDDNGDQWVDCQDEGCWSAPACEPDAVIAWVRAGALRAESRRWREISSSCLFNGRYEAQRGTAQDVAGRVRVERAGRVETCDWRVDRAELRNTSGFHMTHTSSSYFGPGWCRRVETDVEELTRTGFRLEPGCGLDGSGFLPPHLTAEIEVISFSWYRGPFHGTARAVTPGGDVWYGGPMGYGLYRSSFASGGPGDYRATSRALAAPLTPRAPWGSCATGLPTLQVDPGGDVLASCEL